LAVPAAAGEHPGHKKIDRALRHLLEDSARTRQVIITVADGCAPTLLNALQRHGDAVKSVHPLVNAIVAETHSTDVLAMAGNACVEAVSADAEVFATSRFAKFPARRAARRRPHAPVSPGPAMSNVLRETLGLPAVAAGDTMTGATGIGVAVIDSGIAPSLDFAGRITAFYDFTRGGMATVPYDDYGHGTHVAGLIGSSGFLSSYQFQGIAPAVNLIGLKVLDREGRGRTSDVIAALEFVTLNRARLNVHIVNLSLGHPIHAPAKDDPLVRAVERASSAGLIVLVSAGNVGLEKKNGDTGYTGITSPGNAPSAITVGAAMHQATVERSDDVVAPYSSRGPSWFDAYAKPDVVAPGHRLLSDTTLNSYLYRNQPAKRGNADNGLPVLELSGTSMSTAVTSGVVALLLQQHHQNGFHRQKPLTANLVKAMLQFSAVPVAGADYLTQGAGQINAAGALALVRSIDTGERAGRWWLRSGITPVTVIGGETAEWSQRVVWNNVVLTGDLVYYNLPQWSVGAAFNDNIIWGADADNIIWGSAALVADDNIIWGATTTWAANLVWRDRILGLDDGDNIIWGSDDNIIWGTLDFDNIIWGAWDGDDVIWGTWTGDDIIWGTGR
jgi:serine protease AprX